MNITGTIKKLIHQPLLQEPLNKFDINVFNINTVPTSCIVYHQEHSFAISKWVSPKRTRSYPFERVYNTLDITKKITVIPIVKDEGINGDRDFVQWDTISLMSLLDTYVIFAYYYDAEASKKAGKIKNQKFDNDYIKSKIEEITKFHSSALHWNLSELEYGSLHPIIEKTKCAYQKIQDKTGVKLHDVSGIDRFKDKIQIDTSIFKDFSREKAAQAQAREFVTLQPKESLSTLSKAKITITNYLGGQYFLTVDEVCIKENTIQLIEGKHSSTSLLPSKGDIKDGLLKMALYSNLEGISVDEKCMSHISTLSLTSPKLKGFLSSHDSKEKMTSFIHENKFNIKQIEMIRELINGAKQNNFSIIFKYSK